MKLSTYSDYSLRVLMYLGAHPGENATIGGIAAAYGISGNHLMKVVHHLGQRGYIETTRGKGGGLRLAREPSDIRIGAFLRETEDDTRLAECFDRGNSNCRIAPACAAKGVLRGALDAFYADLDRHTLEDMLKPRARIARLLAFVPRPGPSGRAA